MRGIQNFSLPPGSETFRTLSQSDETQIRHFGMEMCDTVFSVIILRSCSAIAATGFDYRCESGEESLENKGSFGNVEGVIFSSLCKRI